MVKVSVIIPVFNVEKYLHQCIDSILNQTLKDIEIICVDDGSTDNSLSILKEYEQTDIRLKVIEQQNQGAGIARNKGMKIAKGKYLSILDADDFFEADMLEKAYNQCEQYNADFCVYRSDQFDNVSKKYIAIPWTIKQRYLPDKEVFSAEDISQYIFQIFNGWSWDKMYRRDFVEKNKLEFQGLRTTNDAFFVFMTNVQAKKITILDEVLAHHRVNTKTSLSVTREKSWSCCYEAMNAIKKELILRNQFKLVEQSFINWCLHFCLWNLRTLTGKAKKDLLVSFKERYFDEIGISEHPEEFFYDKREYNQYLSIKEGKINNVKNESLIRKGFRFYKECGFIATIKKIVEYIK